MPFVMEVVVEVEIGVIGGRVLLKHSVKGLARSRVLKMTMDNAIHVYIFYV